MNFTDWVFLPFFLATFVLFQLCATQTHRHVVLTVASYFFYGWWDWRFLPLILFITAAGFAGGRFAAEHRSRGVAAMVIGVLLAPLAFFKYTTFLLGTVGALWGSWPDAGFAASIILPVGISFFTFHAISYVLDARSSAVAVETSLLRFALYIAFFPLLVAGPIVRSVDLLPQLSAAGTLPSARVASLCLVRFLWGMSKKLLVADPIARTLVDPVFASLDKVSLAAVILATIGFTIQIYADFSAYSDMATALARVFGFRVKENFRAPYLSCSIADFWRRWHISLSTLIRLYLYIPLGGSRCGATRRAFNYVVTMLLCGLWHGAGWTFILWGGLHGGALAGARLLPALPANMAGRVLGWVATQTLVAFGWFLFRVPSVGDITTAARRFTEAPNLAYDLAPAALWPLFIYALVIGAEHAIITSAAANGLARRLQSALANRFALAQVTAVGMLLLLLILYDKGGENQPFLYFRF